MDELKTHQFVERQDSEQYFFDKDTVIRLSQLALGDTACLCTPTVGEILINNGRTDVFVFDSDHRLASIYPANQFWIYDLERGLHSHANDQRARHLISEFLHRFNTVIFDPPFSTDIGVVARNINAFLSWGYNNSSVYVAYPRAGLEKLNELLLTHSIYGQEHPTIEIGYINPPEHYRPGSKKKISLLWFQRV